MDDGHVELVVVVGNTELCFQGPESTTVREIVEWACVHVDHGMHLEKRTAGLVYSGNLLEMHKRISQFCPASSDSAAEVLFLVPQIRDWRSQWNEILREWNDLHRTVPDAAASQRTVESDDDDAVPRSAASKAEESPYASKADDSDDEDQETDDVAILCKTDTQKEQEVLGVVRRNPRNRHAVLLKGAHWVPSPLQPGENRDRMMKLRAKLAGAFDIREQMDGSADICENIPLTNNPQFQCKLNGEVDFAYRLLRGTTGRPGSTATRKHRGVRGTRPHPSSPPLYAKGPGLETPEVRKPSKPTGEGSTPSGGAGTEYTHNDLFVIYPREFALDKCAGNVHLYHVQPTRTLDRDYFVHSWLPPHGASAVLRASGGNDAGASRVILKFSRHMGPSDVRSVEIRISDTPMANPFEISNAVEQPVSLPLKSVVIKSTMSEFQIYREIRQNQSTAAASLMSKIQAHMEANSMQGFDNFDFYVITPCRKTLNWQTIHRVRDRNAIHRSHLQGSEDAHMEQRVIMLPEGRFEVKTGDDKLTTDIDGLIRHLLSKPHAHHRAAADMLLKIRNHPKTLFVVFYDECHQRFNEDMLATQITYHLTSDNDLRNHCIFVGVSATPHNQMQLIMDAANCVSVLKDRVVRLEPGDGYVGREQFVSTTPSACSPVTRCPDVQARVRTKEDFRMASKGWPDLGTLSKCMFGEVECDYVSCILKATERVDRLLAGSVRSEDCELLGTHEAIGCLCRNTRAGLVVMKVATIAHAHDFAKYFARLLKYLARQNEKLDHLAHIAVWRSTSPEGIICENPPKGAARNVCSFGDIPVEGQHASVLVITVSTGTEGDTYPSPFLCYDTRGRLSPKPEQRRWSFLEQVIGRAYGYGARPRLLLYESVFAALREPSKCVSLGVLLINAGKSVEKQLRLLREYLANDPGDVDEDSLDLLRHLGILGDTALHPNGATDVGFDRFFLTAYPQSGKTGAMLCLIELFAKQYHWVGAGAPSLEYPSIEKEGNKTSCATVKEHMAWFENGEYGQPVVLYDWSNAPSDWRKCYSLIGESNWDRALLRRLDFKYRRIVADSGEEPNVPMRANELPAAFTVYALEDHPRFYLSVPSMEADETGKNDDLPTVISSTGFPALANTPPPKTDVSLVCLISAGRAHCTAEIERFLNRERKVLLVIPLRDYAQYRSQFPRASLFVVPEIGVSRARNACLIAAYHLSTRSGVWVIDDNVEPTAHVWLRPDHGSYLGSPKTYDLFSVLELIESSDFKDRDAFSIIGLYRQPSERTEPQLLISSFAHSPAKCVMYLNTAQLSKLQRGPNVFDETVDAGEDMALFADIAHHRLKEKLANRVMSIGPAIRFNRVLFLKRYMNAGGCSSAKFRDVAHADVQLPVRELLDVCLPGSAPGCKVAPKVSVFGSFDFAECVHSGSRNRVIVDPSEKHVCGKLAVVSPSNGLHECWTWLVDDDEVCLVPDHTVPSPNGADLRTLVFEAANNDSTRRCLELLMDDLEFEVKDLCKAAASNERWTEIVSIMKEEGDRFKFKPGVLYSVRNCLRDVQQGDHGQKQQGGGGTVPVGLQSVPKLRMTKKVLKYLCRDFHDPMRASLLLLLPGSERDAFANMYTANVRGTEFARGRVFAHEYASSDGFVLIHVVRWLRRTKATDEQEYGDPAHESGEEGDINLGGLTVRGIPNLDGTACFLSATLQMLLRVPSVRTVCAVAWPGDLTSPLVDNFRAFIQSYADPKSSLQYRKFLACFRKEFNFVGQTDAAEALQQLLNKSEFFSQALPRVSYEEIIECVDGEHQSNILQRDTHLLQLRLECFSANSARSLVQQWMSGARVSVLCDLCNNIKRSKQQTRAFVPPYPDHLIIWFDRTADGHKAMRKVELDQFSIGSQIFNPSAAVYHIGDTAESGHYIACIWVGDTIQVADDMYISEGCLPGNATVVLALYESSNE